MNVKKILILSVLVGLFILPISVFADLKVDPETRYLLLATTKTSTMQKELNEASAMGFRVLMGSPTSGKEMVLLLERLENPQDAPQYYLRATSRTETMQKELDEMSEKGYRLLPKTLIAKEGFMGVEIVCLMEKLPETAKHYKYALLATSRTSTMQKEILVAREEGYVICGIVSRGEHMVIMELEQ